MYLEQRATQDLVRNGLVSVFLRTMEYCQGVMFLTTNRASLFDPAALSRIHLKLKYDDLKANARHEVWVSFLNRANTIHGSANISATDLDSLSKTQLNGREVRLLPDDLLRITDEKQIKNTVSVARKLAMREGSRVLFSHLKRAVSASKEFMDEFNGTEHASSLFF